MHATEKTATQETPNAPAHDLGQVGNKPQAKKEKRTMSRKTISHAKLPPKVINEVHLIEVDRIEIRENVRTVFDEEGLQELASDIEAHGLLQPVLVTPIGDEKYRLVCGERRLRAIRLLKQGAIPALISKIPDTEASIVQLAENIQREDMSLKDTAAVIRRLFDVLQSIEAVANRVKKSKPWVSKHLATTYEGFGNYARQLMDKYEIEDLELLNTMSQIEKNNGGCPWRWVSHAFEEISKGQMNRQQARDYLKAIKENRNPLMSKEEDNARKKKGEEQRKAAEIERKKSEEQQAKKRKEQREGTGEDFIEWACWELDELLCSDDTEDDAMKFINGLSQAQRQALQQHIDAIIAAHKEPAKGFDWWKNELQPWSDSNGTSYFEKMAILASMYYRQPIELMALVTIIEGTRK